MDNILTATDLSERSNRALRRAALIAAETGARLTVLHVVDADLAERIASAHRAEAEQAIGEQLDQMPDGLGRDRVAVSVVTGDPFSEILSASWRCDADLVVMGTHRRHGLREFFLGTTIERVTRKGERPVLVVRDEPIKPYQRVVVAVDLSVGSRRALQAALRLVPRGEIHLIHAYNTPFSSILTDPSTHQRVAEEHRTELANLVEQEMAAYAKHAAARPAAEIHIDMMEGEVMDVLSDECRRVQPDLTALGTHARSGIALQLLGSVAEMVLDNPPSDVLVVKGW